jgi:hypothetical protein
MNIPAVCAIVMTVALADGDVPSSPDASPFSWRPVERTAQTQRRVEVPSTLVGVAALPARVQMVTFRDERPYGGSANTLGQLVEYKAVPIASPDGKSVVNANISVVVNPGGEIVAAFTDAAPVWAHSGWTSGDITKRAAECWEFASPTGTQLKSSIAEVLQAVWKHYGVKPDAAGQITLRPREFARKTTMLDPNGKPLPRQKANGWLVEVLGTHAGTTSFGANMSTQLVVFRDGDLEFSGGLTL